MKALKKGIALLVAFVMAFGMSINAFAAVDSITVNSDMTYRIDDGKTEDDAKWGTTLDDAIDYASKSTDEGGLGAGASDKVTMTLSAGTTELSKDYGYSEDGTTNNVVDFNTLTIVGHFHGRSEQPHPHDRWRRFPE